MISLFAVKRGLSAIIPNTKLRIIFASIPTRKKIPGLAKWSTIIGIIAGLISIATGVPAIIGYILN